MSRGKRALILIVACLPAAGLAAAGPAEARSATTVYDGAWQMSFMTRSGACDPSYEFNVNITRGVITHPKLVRFYGRVARNGAARASVAIQDKFASGSGRLSRTDGRGSWSGFSGTSRRTGQWIARRI